MIDDLKGDESWRMFRIISEFTEGFDKLADIGFPSPSLARQDSNRTTSTISMLSTLPIDL
jgi:hypothetical protein